MPNPNAPDKGSAVFYANHNSSPSETDELRSSVESPASSSGSEDVRKSSSEASSRTKSHKLGAVRRGSKSLDGKRPPAKKRRAAAPPQKNKITNYLSRPEREEDEEENASNSPAPMSSSPMTPPSDSSSRGPSLADKAAFARIFQLHKNFRCIAEVSSQPHHEHFNGKLMRLLQSKGCEFGRYSLGFPKNLEFNSHIPSVRIGIKDGKCVGVQGDQENQTNVPGAVYPAVVAKFNGQVTAFSTVSLVISKQTKTFATFLKHDDMLQAIAYKSKVENNGGIACKTIIDMTKLPYSQDLSPCFTTLKSNGHDPSGFLFLRERNGQIELLAYDSTLQANPAPNHAPSRTALVDLTPKTPPRLGC